MDIEDGNSDPIAAALTNSDVEAEAVTRTLLVTVSRSVTKTVLVGSQTAEVLKPTTISTRKSAKGFQWLGPTELPPAMKRYMTKVD